MRVTVTGTVRNANKEEVKIPIFTEELEAMIVEKAKKQGIEGYEGRIWKHLDEQIISVLVDE